MSEATSSAAPALRPRPRWLPLLVGLLLASAGLWLALAGSWRMAALGGVLALLAAPLLVAGLRRVERQRRWIALCAVNTAAVWLTLAVLSSLRIGTPSGQDVGDAELGWAPTPHPGHVGMRDEAIDRKRPRILFVGDSIVFGHGVQAHETMTAALERQLPGWQVLNAAVQGYSPEQELGYLRRIIDEVRPHVVVVGAYTGNDFSTAGREFSWGHSKPLYLADPTQTASNGLRRIDRAGPCIDRLAQSPLFRMLWQDRKLASSIIETLCEPLALDLRQTREVIAASYAGIDAVAKQRGAKVLHVLMQEQREYHVDGYKPNEFMTVRLRGHEITRLVHAGAHPVLDSFPVLGADPEVASRAFLEDHAHLTPFGHQRLADAIAQRLRAADFAIVSPPGAAFPPTGPSGSSANRQP